MTEKEKKRIGVFLSLILRHKPEVIGITLDNHGWADVSALIEGVNATDNYHIDMSILEEIVATNNKKRYSFNSDKTKIRANQGHSIKVDVELKIAEPPEILYHGTGEKSIEAIKKDGIKSRSRLYVHLSEDRRTAEGVGKRHGKPYIFKVHSGKMNRAGFKFYLSENGVWLTEFVPIEFLEET